MELFSLMALVNFAANMSGKFQGRRKQGERHEQSLLHQSFDRELFRARCEEERHQAAQSRAHDWELAAQQRQSALDLQENQKVLDHWPLRLFPSQILKTAVASGPVPLRVLISPPKHLMFDLEGSLRPALRTFVTEYYGFNSSERPVELLDGAWRDGNFQGAASIKALHARLQSEPTLVLEMQALSNGESLSLNLAAWGPADSQYRYDTVLQFDIRSELETSARRRATQWKAARDKLISAGLADSPEEADQRFGGIRAKNLKRIEQEDALQAAGVNLADITLPAFELEAEDYAEIQTPLITWSCLAIGWVADLYFASYWERTPQLPNALPKLLTAEKNLGQGLNEILGQYSTTYQALIADRPIETPILLAQLAKTMLGLADRRPAQEVLERAVSSWCALRELSTSSPEGYSLIQHFLSNLAKDTKLNEAFEVDSDFRHLLCELVETLCPELELNCSKAFDTGLAARREREAMSLLTRVFEQVPRRFTIAASLYAPLSESLLSEYKDRWDWAALALNKHIFWSESLLDRHIDRVYWPFISSNPNVDWSANLLKKYQKKLHWSALSENEHLPWDESLISEFSKLWDWEALSDNRNLPWSDSLISRFSELWDWQVLSGNQSLPWTAELIERYKARWDWFWLCSNTALPWREDLIAFYQKHVDFYALSDNLSVTWTSHLIEKYAEKWDW
ncbi:hypothetical protein Thiowin_01285 [Thiorhodovibrio winogradskyi]|uniref:Uncharacterized protein n=2 Tax=Thiorhodovibrio winogradskyi TaxID=77007 RepID=A0ABZ0S7P3_9GAMM